MRTVSVFGAAMLAASCLAPVNDSLALEPPQPLSGRELQVLLLGNTLIGLDEDGPFWMYYPSADTLWGRSSAGDVDVGRWWIENNSYCRTWRRWFEGQTRCWQMARVGEDQVYWYSLQGDSTGRSILREGNAMGDVPSETGTASQLADAGSGLASALEAVVARAVVSPDQEIGPRTESGNAAERSRAEQPPRTRANNRSGLEAKPPLVFNGEEASGAAAGAAGAAAAAGAASSGFSDTKLGGFLDRIGVRSGSTPSGESGGGAAGGDEGGGGREARGGSERDRG